MRISSIKLTNFKRFTDFEIAQIPPTAKLVVVVGPNGCGKSSLFDAFLHWYHSRAGFGHHDDKAYYQKLDGDAFDWNRVVDVTLHGDVQPRKGMLYVRSAYRNDPDFAVDGINRPENPSEHVRLTRIIDNDQTVSDNYRRLIYDTMASVYNEDNNEKTVRILREELIGNIRKSMRRVFGDLVLNNVSNPLGSGSFHFQKGTVSSYHYKNLSGGEKAAFDLILDLHTKSRFFTDAIYCVDELETHLHTRVQGALIKEMVNIVPDVCQLWVTTHSLGVLRAAQEMIAKDPSSTCLIDFDGVDPDVPRTLIPSNVDRVTWEKLLSITLDDLAVQIAPRTIVVCEGSAVGTRRKDFDAEIYNRVLGNENAEVVFVSGGSSNQVHATSGAVRDALKVILRASQFRALADRDDKSDEEVARLEKLGTLVLPVRNIESYLFADDVIAALARREGKEGQLNEALEIKREALNESRNRNNPEDDLKSAAGDIYNGLKKCFGLKRCGNDKDAFMRDTLAVLVKPPLPTYYAMKAAIIDRLKTEDPIDL